MNASKRTRRAEHNRPAMIERVRNDWIRGVLEQSLYHVARAELGLDGQPEAMERPWTLLVQQQGQVPRRLPPDARMSEVFDELGRAMLILGAPGAGKTMLLLELANDLLDRAARDPEHPIPAVFHLSSWALRRKPLSEWMMDELNRRYDVPQEVARAWVEGEAVLPLLDGLDEVAAEHHVACVEAINAWQLAHGRVSMAVCSHTQEFEALAVRLRLRGAVAIEPMTRPQVDAYLEGTGPALLGVRAALARDETLYELLDTPLMLSVATLAYGEESANALQAVRTVEERRERLLAAYVDATYERRAAEARYTRAQTDRWLSWLARQMRVRDQSAFQVEQMQPGWLPKKRQRWLVTWGAAMLSGLIAWLLVWLGIWLGTWPFTYLLLDSAPLNVGLNVGLVVGLVFGLTGGLVRGAIAPTAARDWSWQKAARGLAIGLILGLVGASLGWLAGMLASPLIGGGDDGLIASPAGQRAVIVVGWLAIVLAQGLATWLAGIKSGMWGSALAGGLVGCLAGLPLFQPALNDVERGLLHFCCGPTVGLLFGLSGALAGGLFGGVVADEVPRSGVARQGIRGFARAALISGLIVGSVVGLVVGLVFWVGLWLTSGSPKLALYGLFLVLPVGLAFGVLAGLVAALATGGLAGLRHLVMRVLLVRNDFAPWNYVRFLDYAVERNLLRKVGGGYIFIHRLLQDYLSELWESEYRGAE